ncbi:unnamed protein product [Bursaphelenchus xylophilus]|uniref:(pine wood nematode) hypothetical protein n=1 Tax=Bursaphelenchus xylophilus TaxID=6326 RepID=A0A1I7RK48_BURXY|nr:unnamed protein product [Bursaphelenchus xylophilus]CAG9131511.1 unnamed protein product [Bursaphelenchus xylophilus]
MDCLTPGSTECSYRQGCIKIIARNNTVIRQGCSPVETKKTSHELDLRPYGLPPNLKVYACWTDFCNAMDSSSFLTTSSVSLILFSIWIGLSL